MSVLFRSNTLRIRHSLSKPNLSKFDELGHSSNFEKWSPNLIGSHLRPLERIIMHFWAILAPQEASNNPMNDPLLSRKNDQKNFLTKNSRNWLGRNFCSPKITFLGWVWQKFFGSHQKGPKALKKLFW